MENLPGAIKLIVIDIDGTLLTPTGQITPRTRAAIQAARTAGIVVTLATARRYAGAKAVATALGMELPLIVNDGSLIVSHPSQVILGSQTLSSTVVQQATEIFRRHSIQPIVHPCEEERCIYEEVWTGPAEHDNLELATYLSAAADRVRRMSYEVLCAGSTHALRVVAFAEKDALQAMLPDLAMLDCSWHLSPQGSYHCAELAIMRTGCSKASGIVTLASHYCIGLAQVMAIGDGFNDLKMLQIAGWGVAMGQAPEEVRAAAKTVTSTNLEEGVALAIERYALAQHPHIVLDPLHEALENLASLPSFNILP